MSRALIWSQLEVSTSCFHLHILYKYWFGGPMSVILGWFWFCLCYWQDSKNNTGLGTVQEDCQSFIVSRKEDWLSITKAFKLRKWVALSDLNKKALPKSFIVLAPESGTWEYLSFCTQIKFKSLLTQFIHFSQRKKLLSQFS